MVFRLKSLGRYKIVKTEDYEGSRDFKYRSYHEIIPVRGSRIKPPFFMIPSHLYKYSETKLAVYLKDHKNRWRDLGKLLDVDINMRNEEIVFIFPISKFEEIEKIIPFMKQGGLAILPEDRKKEMIARLKYYREINTNPPQNEAKLKETGVGGNINQKEKENGIM